MLILSSVFSAFPLELSVSFSSTEYSVDEDAGTVSVCLELSDDQLTREAAFTPSCNFLASVIASTRYLASSQRLGGGSWKDSQTSGRPGPSQVRD